MVLGRWLGGVVAAPAVSCLCGDEKVSLDAIAGSIVKSNIICKCGNPAEVEGRRIDVPHKEDWWRRLIAMIGTRRHRPSIYP